VARRPRFLVLGVPRVRWGSQDAENTVKKPVML
jgi:hypothetical protein